MQTTDTSTTATATSTATQTTMSDAWEYTYLLTAYRDLHEALRKEETQLELLKTLKETRNHMMPYLNLMKKPVAEKLNTEYQMKFQAAESSLRFAIDDKMAAALQVLTSAKKLAKSGLPVETSMVDLAKATTSAYFKMKVSQGYILHHSRFIKPEEK